jgi:hypothetical protein
MRRAMLVLLVLVAAVALTAGPAVAAITVSYTVDGWGPTYYPGNPVPAGAPHLLDGYGYPGDAVGLVTYTDTLNLTPGTYYQKINTLSWDVNYTYNGTDDLWTNDTDLPRSTYWPELQFTITAIRSMSFDGGPAASISQLGSLRTNWDNDFLGMSEGLTTTFYVPGYQIDVTPLGLSETEVLIWDGSPPCSQPSRDVMARFDVTAIPEPATILVWGLLGVVAAGYGVWRRRRVG